MAKTRSGFDSSLTLISLFGFLVIALESFTTLNIQGWTTFVLMALAGGGLMLEGNILTIRNWSKDGIQRLEVPYLLSIVFGLFTVILGILNIPLFTINIDSLNVLKGVVAVFAMVFISLQRWVID